MSKALLAVAIVIFGVLGLGSSHLLKSMTQQARPPVEATKIHPGVMSEKQREHSKLYKSYAKTLKGKKLVDRRGGVGDVKVYIEAPLAKPRKERVKDTFVLPDVRKIDIVEPNDIENNSSENAESEATD